MKLADCKRGMELKPIRACDFTRFVNQGAHNELVIRSVIVPKNAGDPILPGITFCNIHGVFDPRFFEEIKKPNELVEGDKFIKRGVLYKILANAFDEDQELMIYLVKKMNNGSIVTYSEKEINKSDIVYGGGK